MIGMSLGYPKAYFLANLLDHLTTELSCGRTAELFARQLQRVVSDDGLPWAALITRSGSDSEHYEISVGICCVALRLTG